METNQYRPPLGHVKNDTRPKSVWKKRTAAFSRWLHTYLSMISFTAVLFFAVTGITLNHAEWFEGKPVEKKLTGNMPSDWVKMQDTAQIKKLEIVEFLRSNYGVRGYLSDFLTDDQQCSLSFKGPGYSADAFISRKDGAFRLSELRLGLAAVLNDLHKGRDTGNGWSWMIDLSAGFLALVSVSGLMMLFFLKKKRVSGILLLIIGGLIGYLVYCFLVP